MAKIGIISLGCPRNLVDSEVMLGILKADGHEITESIDGSDIAILNTCAFVKDATDESIDTILAAIDLKKRSKIKQIIVAGCLPQRYKKKLKLDLKEIDGFIGTDEVPKIAEIIKDITTKKKYAVSHKPSFIYDDTFKRDFITPLHYRYIKIQEGCSNRCAYCIIPTLRGPLRSRELDSILREVEALPKTSELNIIGQDTTHYGYDLYKRPRIAELLRAIAGLKKARWIRLLYAHPAHITDDLIDVMKHEEHIVKYLDLPIQHISDSILKKMSRKTTSKEIHTLIARIRHTIPGIAIRSTVLVGFPGESDKDFKELLSFIKKTRFERLGAFAYSNEEGSRSSRFKGQVPDKIKAERLDEVMKLQKNISLDYNRSFLGQRLEVMIDEKNKEEGLYLARTEFDAPSVDGQVFVKGQGLKCGDFVKVKITDTLEYDLVGERV